MAPSKNAEFIRRPRSGPPTLRGRLLGGRHPVEGALFFYTLESKDHNKGDIALILNELYSSILFLFSDRIITLLVI